MSVFIDEAEELGRRGKDAPPTPEDIDTLLAYISAAGYASEAVATIEAWIEGRYAIVGEYTAKRRLEGPDA